MKITIFDVTEIKDEVFVGFKSEAGWCIARWLNKIKPEINKCYDVEIDVDKKVSETLINEVNENIEQKLTIVGNYVMIIANIESIESDGVAFLRLSQDCLIMMETGDIHCSVDQRVVLKLDSTDINVTAQGI